MSDKWIDLILSAVEGFSGPTDCTKVFTDGDLAVTCKQSIDYRISDMDPRMEIIKEAIEGLHQSTGYGSSGMTYIALALAKYGDKSSYLILLELIDEINNNLKKTLRHRFEPSHAYVKTTATPTEQRAKEIVSQIASQVREVSDVLVTCVESDIQSEISLFDGCILPTLRPRKVPTPPIEIIQEIPYHPNKRSFRCCFILSISEQILTSQGTSIDVNYPDELRHEITRMKEQDGIDCIVVGQIKTDLVWEICEDVGIHVIGELQDTDFVRFCDYANCSPLDCVDIFSNNCGRLRPSTKDAIVELFLSRLPGVGIFIAQHGCNNSMLDDKYSIFFSHPLSHRRDRVSHAVTKHIHKSMQLKNSSQTGTAIPGMGFFEALFISRLRDRNSSVSNPLADTIYGLLVRICLNQGITYDVATEEIDRSIYNIGLWLSHTSTAPPAPPLLLINDGIQKGDISEIGYECLNVKYGILISAVQLARVLTTTRVLQLP